MSYRQSLTSSFPDRMGWFFVQLSGDINILLSTRNASKLATSLNGMRDFTATNHPDKSAAVEDLITSIEDMIAKLEIALDA